MRPTIPAATPAFFRYRSADVCVRIARLQVGAMADSGHEYLLKQYLLTNKTDTALLEMCACLSGSYLRAPPTTVRVR